MTEVHARRRVLISGIAVVIVLAALFGVAVYGLINIDAPTSSPQSASTTPGLETPAPNTTFDTPSVSPVPPDQRENVTDLRVILVLEFEEHLETLTKCGRCERHRDDKCEDRALAWDDVRFTLEDVTCGCGCWTRAAFRLQLDLDPDFDPRESLRPRSLLEPE